MLEHIPNCLEIQRVRDNASRCLHRLPKLFELGDTPEIEFILSLILNQKIIGLLFGLVFSCGEATFLMSLLAGATFLMSLLACLIRCLNFISDGEQLS